MFPKLHLDSCNCRGSLSPRDSPGVRTTPYSTITCQQVAVVSGMSSGVEQVGGVHYFQARTLVGVSAGDGYLGESWLATSTGSGLHKMAQAQE